MIKLNASKLRRDLEIRDSRFYSIREMAAGCGLLEETISNLIYNKTVVLDTRTLGKLVYYFQKRGLVLEVGDFFRWEGKELLLNIDGSLTRLDPIPTAKELSDFTKIYKYSIENMAHGHVRRIRLSHLWLFLKYFRNRGLEVKLGDLLLEEDADSHSSKNNHHKIVRDQKSEYLACVESVPIICVNIIALKDRLIAKKGKVYSNSQIARRAQIFHYTFEGLIKGDITRCYLSTMGKLFFYFQSEGLVINVGDFFRWEGKKLVLNIDSLMARLGSIPTSQKVGRAGMPVHDETGISFLRIEKLVRGHVKQISFRNLGALLLFFRKRGLSIDLGDLLMEEGAQPKMFSENVEEPVRLAEERKALEIAGNMVSLGMDVEQIATVTDLSPERIKALALP